MDFGIFAVWNAPLPGRTQAEAFTESFDEVDLLERMGWDYVYLAELSFAVGLSMLSAPLVLAAAVAARTRRIKLGLAVHTPRLRVPGESLDNLSDVYQYAFQHVAPADPITTAEQGATVDQISRGRFIYGAGGLTRGLAGRRDQFLEWLAVIKQLWTEDKFSGFEGKYFNYPPFPEGMGLTPKPYQKPCPPILCSVDSQETFVPMGTLGYRISIGLGTAHNPRGESAVKEDVRKYKAAWKAAGHPGDPTVVVRIPTHLADTKEEALRDVAMYRSVRESLGRKLPPGPHLAVPLPEREQRNLFTTPEEAVERIQEIQEQFGANEIMFQNNLPAGVPRDRLNHSIRLITEKVIPKFK